MTTDFVQSLSNEHDYVFPATSFSKDTPQSEHMYITQCSSSCIPKCQVKVQGQYVEMIVDSGASVNIIKSATIQRLRDKPPLYSLPIRVYTYDSYTPLPVTGIANLDLQYNSAYLSTQVHIVEGNKGNLLGFKAAEELKILTLTRQILTLTRQITSVRKNDAENATDVGSIVKDYWDFFPGIRKFRNRMVSLHIEESVTPKQQPHRRIPFQIGKDVEQELARLEAEDVIEKTESPTPWVSPVVVVSKKKSKEVRICIDVRNANKVVHREKHLIPRTDDLITYLNGATTFSTLDLKAGYHQLELDPASRHITTFSTHRAIYRYKRLMFGIKAVSEIFQNTVAELRHGLTDAATSRMISSSTARRSQNTMHT